MKHGYVTIGVLVAALGAGPATSVVQDAYQQWTNPNRPAIEQAIQNPNSLERMLGVAYGAGSAGQAKADEYAKEGRKAFSNADYATALDRYKKSVELVPEAARYSVIASCLINLGEPKQAEEYAKKGIQVDPNESSLYTNLAEAYEKQGRLTEAKQAVGKALEIKKAKGLDLQPGFLKVYDRIMAY